MSVTPAPPYLRRFAYLDLRSGRLAVHGDVHIVATPDTLPAIEFAGDVVSDDFKLYDSLKDQDFFGYHVAASSPGRMLVKITL